jgi:hypothetical protein
MRIELRGLVQSVSIKEKMFLDSNVIRTKHINPSYVRKGRIKAAVALLPTRLALFTSSSTFGAQLPRLALHLLSRALHAHRGTR